MKRQTIVGTLAAVTLAACQNGADSGLSEQQMQTRTALVPARTAVVVSLNSEVSSKTGRSGDDFLTTLAEPIFVDDQIVLAAGTPVRGELTRVHRPDDGSVVMELRLTDVQLPGGVNEDIHTGDLQLVAKGTSTEDDLEKVAIGGVAGGILGAVVGGGKGAAIGAAAGAGAGTVVAVVTHDDGEIVIPAGQKMQFVLAESASIPVPTIS